ncbi:MAG: DUF4124 domain-containing protein [Neptunomonas phycophila]|uniref:DUF4124 domain-containing protein n=1 Tax=Neptunomonas phycophila TaxID=1572645 RepID=UPI003B8E53FE
MPVKTYINVKSVALVFASCAMAGIVQADIYRWVDEQGVVHYSDQAPAGVDAQKKAYNNVATPFRNVSPSAFPKEPVSQPVPTVNPEKTDEEQDSGEVEKDPKSKRSRGTADLTDAVKYNDADKQTLSERKQQIIEDTHEPASKLSERKSKINAEYKKILNDYRARRQTTD